MDAMDALAAALRRDDARCSPVGLAKALGLGICARCCLRFANVDAPRIYCLEEQQVRDALRSLLTDAGEDAAVVGATPLGQCACCLGVLGDAFKARVLADTKCLALERRDDADSFALNIKLPSAVLLREYALLAHLRASNAGFGGRSPADLKDVLKSLVASDISTLLNSATCSNASAFAVLLEVAHPESADEVKQIPAIKTQLESAKKRHRGPAPVFDGFGAVTRALAALTTIPETVASPPAPPSTGATARVVLEREPVYLQGRYLKLKRGLSQTPWVLDGQRMGDSSVEECIGEVALPFFRGQSYKFHTAGREDVDVRMLGNGRPFILEVLDAKTTRLTAEDYATIEAAVNEANRGAIEIRATKASTKEYFAGLQAGADSKKKTYCCVVWTEAELTPAAVAKLDGICDLTIQQKTPVRVLHRRTLMTRPKVIHAAACEVLNAHYMLLRLTTSAGTYVKEFVHGDRGRTQPNVSTILGCDADILQLDVESLIDAQ